MLKRCLSASLFFLASTTPLFAGTVRFEAWGTVASASGATGAYTGVAVGQNAHLLFEVTTPGTDVNPGHVTNFAIIPSSLAMTMGPVTVVNIGATPSATMRNQDFSVDGVIASATLTGSKNLGFSFSDVNGSMFSSTDPEQNLGSWSGNFYSVFGFTISGTGTFIDIDFSAFELSLPHTGTPLCFGDGTQASACPCSNAGIAGHGCENSIGSGGALLSGLGSLTPDALVLTSSGELPNASSVFLQGNQLLAAPVIFGDGLRCTGGVLKRLYVKSASGGVVSAPAAGDPSISARSAALGDTLTSGTTRWYQVYYRDPNPGFCPAPQGSTWNVTNAIAIDW
ncbi:MAG: hypothetical protein IPJ19_17270 [Planctomycetes bacterium]|nr:hypothetical protein [Planctomycetota bacterium]